MDTTLTEPMPGTRPIAATALVALHAEYVQAVRALRTMPHRIRTGACGGYSLQNALELERDRKSGRVGRGLVAVIRTERGLRRAQALAAEFPMVARDLTVTRAVQGQRNQPGWTPAEAQVTVPLVFAVRLPTGRTHTFEAKNRVGTNVRVSATVPTPPREALQALAAHQTRFDRCEVWWVPNQVLVEPLPKPDPILVGVCDAGWAGPQCFTLHRWIDDTVEAAYWAREGY